jgi:catechol-2,3-dioxygenase
MMLRLQRLDHVSLNARDRLRSVAWYRETLGLAQQNDPTDDSEPVFMGSFGACIALFQATTEGPEPVYESPGLRHVAFMLTGEALVDAAEHLERLSVPFRREDHGNALSLYLPDPDGNVIELTTYDR